jgi:DNA-binding transcriptional ArsR family regulator
MDTFTAIAEPTRRRILDELRASEHSVGELVEALAVSQPAVSKHLNVLRTGGLVSFRIDAQRRIYRVEPGPFQTLDEWLAPYRDMWTERLDALERHLADQERPGARRSVQPPGKRPATTAGSIYTTCT